MSDSAEQTLIDEHGLSDRSPNYDGHQGDLSLQGWEGMAQAWVRAFPEAKPVDSSQVEAWLDSNFGSLPPGLRSMPRSELIDRLLTIQHYLRPSNESEHKSPIQPDQHPARFQRTNRWLPVYSWLESLDHHEVVKSKDISDWLDSNPQVKEELCSRHSRYHLMHYIKKCHMKILKRKEKKGLVHPSSETTLHIHKDDAEKQPMALSGNPLKSIPEDSDAYQAKRNDALRKFEILVELEKKLAPIFSRPQMVNK